MVYFDAWRDEAACVGQDLEVFFPETSGNCRKARQVCFSCPVRVECLVDSLSHETFSEFGIRGGLTPEQRRKIVRRKRAQDRRLARTVAKMAGMSRPEAEATIADIALNA